MRGKNVAQIVTKIPRAGWAASQYHPSGSICAGSNRYGLLPGAWSCSTSRRGLIAGPGLFPRWLVRERTSERRYATHPSFSIRFYGGGARKRRAPCDFSRHTGPPCGAADVFVHGRSFSPRARGFRSSSPSAAHAPLKFRPNRSSFLRVAQ